MTEPPHSAFVLTDIRDDWWNPDFIALMASRLRLAECRHVLDLGSGHGHWGHLWARHLAPDAEVLGLDQEPEWIERATERSARLGLTERFSYRLGRAEDLPLHDESFDLVTCQTLLMHVADPTRVLAEMKRVLRPGGLLLLAEPNNLAPLLMFDSVRRRLSSDDVLRLVRFHLACNRGRKRLGEGDYAIADTLPQLLADEGLAGIQVHINDHAAPVFSNAENPPLRLQSLTNKVEAIADERWLWNRAEASRLYFSGDGPADEFDRDFGVFMDEAKMFIHEIETSTYCTTGGAQHYLISARRNSDP
jgi:ubiquinone/menaquinone biosynthesis C-methylase UbiE